MIIRKLRQFPVVEDLYESGIVYPTVSNLSYFWNFGVLALVCLFLQIITGVFFSNALYS